MKHVSVLTTSFAVRSTTRKGLIMVRPVVKFKFIPYFISFFALEQCYALPLSEQAILSPDYPRISHGENKFVLPIFDANAAERYNEIQVNREGYQYGRPLLGNTSFFPTGALGDAMVQRDKQLWFQDVQYITDSVMVEWPQSARALAEASSFKLVF